MLSTSDVNNRHLDLTIKQAVILTLSPTDSVSLTLLATYGQFDHEHTQQGRVHENVKHIQHRRAIKMSQQAITTSESEC